MRKIENIGALIGAVAAAGYIIYLTSVKNDLKTYESENSKLKKEYSDLNSRYNNFQQYHSDQLRKERADKDTVIVYDTKYLPGRIIEDKHKIDSLEDVTAQLNAKNDSITNQYNYLEDNTNKLITSQRLKIYNLKQDSAELSQDLKYSKKLLNVYAISRRPLKTRDFNKLNIPDSVETPLPYNKHNVRKIRSINSIY